MYVIFGLLVYLFVWHGMVNIVIRPSHLGISLVCLCVCVCLETDLCAHVHGKRFKTPTLFVTLHDNIRTQPDDALNPTP